MTKNIHHVILQQTDSLKSALDAMLASGSRIGFVVNKYESVIGTCTYGDLMRASSKLTTISFVENVMEKNFTYLEVGKEVKDIISVMCSKNILAIPVLKKNGKLVDVITPWDIINYLL